MINIHDALDSIFSYERDNRPVMVELVRQGYLVRGVGHLNLEVSDKNLGIEGVIPFLGVVDQRVGAELGFYTAERNLSVDGPKLPAPFQQYNDCSKVHMGVLINCLAYMYKKAVSRLSLICMETNTKVNILSKPHIAELFLWNISKKHTDSLVSAAHSVKNQTTLFQPQIAA